MKSKFVFAALVLSAGVASATEVTTEYTMGAMPLAVSAGDTIINIPWVEAGSESEGIAVSNIVKTANLTVNDYLLWWNGSAYNAWVLTAGTGGTNYWCAASSVSDTGLSVQSASATVLKRGQALILHAQSAATIYIVGQYSENPTESISISQGYNLLAPPIYSGSRDLKSYGWAAAGSGDGDRITMPSGDAFVYDTENGGWGKWKQVDKVWTFTPAAAGVMTITAGKGFWYERNSSSGFTFNWQ